MNGHLTETTRLRAVRALLASDPASEATLSRLVALAARALGVPVAQVNVVTAERQVTLSASGFGEWGERKNVPLEFSFCKHVVASSKPLVVDDARLHPLLRDNLATTESGLVAYLGVPLTLSADLVVGTICAVDFRPRQWARDDIELLEQLAAFAITEIERRGLSEAEVLRLKAIIDSSHDAIVNIARDGTIEAWNGGAQRLLGYTPDEIEGRPASTLLEEGCRNAGARMFERVWAGESQPRQDLSVRVIRRDGTLAPMSVVLTPVRDFAGRITGATAVLRDISERVKAIENLRHRESRFRALIHESSDMITVLAPDGMIIYDSPAVKRMLGYAPQERIGQDVMKYIHPDDVAATSATLARLLNGSAPITVELRALHRDGSERILTVTGTNLVDNPAVGGVVVNSRDITETRRAEEQQRRSQRMEAVGRLASGVAHDFNNLLTAISGNAQLLMDELPPQLPAREEVAEIQHAATRAAELTRQLLAFSRQQPAHVEVVDLAQLLSGMRRMLSRMITADIDFSVNSSADVALVRMDPGQFEQVMMNLVVNARDAMPNGGRLQIELRNASVQESGFNEGGEVPAGSYVFSVSDTGTGMSREVRERIFEPFFTTKPVDRGTGLGLSTVYGIVRQSGGSLHVYSEPGHGSTFRVYLPQANGTPVAERAALDDAGDTGDETVLVVDDDAAIRKLACKILERRGYTVLEADGPIDALGRVLPGHADCIDLLVTDLVMPGIGGTELATRVAQAQPGVRTLFISGYTHDEAVRRGIGPAAHFIEKPFSPDAFARKVRDVLSGPHNM
jgi:two-component system, cell cycle sensor histidine kinase and response regulator CckA